MFKENFVKLCNSKNESPSAVCMKIGLSNAAYSQWDETSVPRKSTLLKLADYFGVSVDYLLGNEEKEKISSPSSRDEIEEQLLERFRSLTKEQQDAYLKIIGINSTKFDKPL